MYMRLGHLLLSQVRLNQIEGIFKIRLCFVVMVGMYLLVGMSSSLSHLQIKLEFKLVHFMKGELMLRMKPLQLLDLNEISIMVHYYYDVVADFTKKR